MAIKNIIARGIGFSPASVKFIVTLGFAIGEAVVPTSIWTAKDDNTTSWSNKSDKSTGWTPKSDNATTWT